MRCAVSAVSVALTPDIQVMPLPHAQDAPSTDAAMRKKMTT
jgi:hypothetical protein